MRMFWVLALSSWTSVLGAQWLAYDNVTAIHLVSDPMVGTMDISERDYATVDIDLDGDMDVIAVRKAPGTVQGPLPNVLFLSSGGVLTDSTALFAPDLLVADNSRDVVAADLDGDSWPDLVVAIAELANPAAQPRVFMNQGEDAMGNWLGLVEDSTRIPVLLSPNGNGPRCCTIAAGDVNGDGFVDLYLGDYQNDLEDKLLFNDGSGFFTDATSNLPAGFPASSFNTTVRIADMNGDGAADVVKNSSRSVRVAYNLGSGVFSGMDQPLAVAAAYSFEVGDLDNDGLNDIFVGQDGQDQFQINQSPVGTIPVAWQANPLTDSPLTVGFVGDIYIVDLDGDSDRDVVVCDQDADVISCVRRLAFLRNDGGTPPSLIDPYDPAFPATHHHGTHDVAIADFDGDGGIDLLIGHCSGTDYYFRQPLGVPLFLRGDANQDDAIDLADAIALLDYLFGSGTLSCFDAGDGNDDGANDLADVIYLLTHLFQMGAAPPAPFPDCGTDHTPDSLTCAFPSC